MTIIPLIFNIVETDTGAIMTSGHVLNAEAQKQYEPDNNTTGQFSIQKTDITFGKTTSGDSAKTLLHSYLLRIQAIRDVIYMMLIRM
jgi:hypothetical protein